MTRSRSLWLASLAVAACSTSPFVPSGPPDVHFSADRAVVAPGSTVHLNLSNASPVAVIARPCPLALQRWNGSDWVPVPDGSFLCSLSEDTVASGSAHVFPKPIDAAAAGGTYRASLMVRSTAGGPEVDVTSTTFTVM